MAGRLRGGRLRWVWRAEHVRKASGVGMSISVTASPLSGPASFGRTMRAQSPSDGSAEISDLWPILWHRRAWIIQVAVVMTVLALVYGLLTPALYTATSQILVDPRDKLVVTNDVNPTAVAPDGGVTQVESQARVIESNGVLLRAITATHLTDDPDFNGSGLLSRLFGPVEGLLQPAKPDGGLTDVQVRTLNALKRRLAVRRADKVLVIDVIVTAKNSDTAARIANAIVDAYLVDQAQSRAQAGRQASDSLSAHLADQQTRLRDAENALERYKTDNNIVTSTGQLVVEQQLNDASAQFAAARSRTTALKAQIDQLDKLRRSGQSTDGTSEAIQSSVIGTLREQESALVQQQSDLRSQLGPRHPKIAAIDSQLADLRKLISIQLDRVTKAVRVEYERAVDNEKMLSAQLDRLKGQTLSTSQASVKLRELQRDVEASRSIYASFLLRSQETRDQSNIDTTNARVISRAIPPLQKSWPPLGFLLIGAFCSGLCIGVALALVAEYLAPTLLSVDQAQRTVQAPVIGVLPKAGKVSARWLRRAPGPSVNDQTVDFADGALRRMFSTDQADRRSNLMRSVLVTSSQRDDAERSRCARLLALVAADRGERVLLIDGNVVGNRPPSGEGLLEILRGERSLEGMVHVERGSGVAVMGTGRLRQSASERQERIFAMRMLEEAQGQFDVLIVDGGVIAENSRLVPIAGMVDEVLLVAELKGTPQRDLATAAEAAAVMGHPITAVLLVDQMVAA